MHVAGMVQACLITEACLAAAQSNICCESCCCAPWQEALPQDDDAS